MAHGSLALWNSKFLARGSWLLALLQAPFRPVSSWHIMGWIFATSCTECGSCAELIAVALHLLLGSDFQQIARDWAGRGGCVFVLVGRHSGLGVIFERVRVCNSPCWSLALTQLVQDKQLKLTSVVLSPNVLSLPNRRPPRTPHSFLVTLHWP